VGCRASRFDRSCLSASAWCGSRSSAPRARARAHARIPGAAPEFPSPLHERACASACAGSGLPPPPAGVCLPHSLVFNCVRSVVGFGTGRAISSPRCDVLCCARRRRRRRRRGGAGDCNETANEGSSNSISRSFVRSFVRTTGDLMAQEEIKVLLHVGVAGPASFVVSSAASLPGSPAAGRRPQAAAALRFAPAGAAPTHAAGTFVL
jgi:hypothetical protein